MLESNGRDTSGMEAANYRACVAMETFRTEIAPVLINANAPYLCYIVFGTRELASSSNKEQQKESCHYSSIVGVGSKSEIFLLLLYRGSLLRAHSDTQSKL